MKNYKITVSYDGTRYKGWQVLKSTIRDKHPLHFNLQLGVRWNY